MKENVSGVVFLAPQAAIQTSLSHCCVLPKTSLTSGQWTKQGGDEINAIFTDWGGLDIVHPLKPPAASTTTLMH